MSARKLAPTVVDQSLEVSALSALLGSSTSMEFAKQGPPNADKTNTGAELNASAVLDMSWLVEPAFLLAEIMLTSSIASASVSLASSTPQQF